MTFIAPNTPAPVDEADTTLENHAFFPALSLTEFREAMRVDTVTTPIRAEQALRMAMFEVNGRVWSWADAHITAGIASIDNTPALPGHPADGNKRLYLAAVWSLAKAQLVERYRDYDTTNKGHNRADDLDPSAADYRRDAAWAINDLMRIPRTTVELI